jgi:hypothetical protein
VEGRKRGWRGQTPVHINDRLNTATQDGPLFYDLSISITYAPPPEGDLRWTGATRNLSKSQTPPFTASPGPEHARTRLSYTERGMLEGFEAPTWNWSRSFVPRQRKPCHHPARSEQMMNRNHKVSVALFQAEAIYRQRKRNREHTLDPISWRSVLTVSLNAIVTTG